VDVRSCSPFEHENRLGESKGYPSDGGGPFILAMITRSEINNPSSQSRDVQKKSEEKLFGKLLGLIKMPAGNVESSVDG